MRKFIAFIAGVLSIVSLASCNGSFSPSGRYHTVTFNSDGGTNISSQQVKHGEKITKPEDPLKNGYVFDYWEYNDEKWSFTGYVVTEDMTLLAKYNEVILDCPTEQTVYIDHDANFTINVNFTPSNQTITARSLDDSVASVTEVAVLDESNASIKMQAKQTGEVDVVIESNYKATKTCHITVTKEFLDVELYDIVKTHYASKSDPSVDNVYLNKKVHFFATVSAYTDRNLFLQRYNQKENKYYGIMLFDGYRPIFSEYTERGTLLEIYGTVAEYNGACEIIEAQFQNPSRDYNGGCKIVKTASENTDALTKLQTIECSASEFNNFYLSNDITFLSLPIKISEALKIKAVDDVESDPFTDAGIKTTYYFDGYDFNLYANTIESAAVGDYLRINYSVVFPTNRLLNNTFSTSEDIVLLH